MKPGYINVVISTGDYYEKKLRGGIDTGQIGVIVL